MIDTEQRLQRGLHAYADAVVVTPPAVSDLLAEPPVVHPPHRARRWAVGIVAGTVAVGGVATATDNIPSPVREMFEEFRGYNDGAYDANLERLRLVASDDTADGGRVDLWFAPNESNGGACLYERIIGPDGADVTRGSASCTDYAEQWDPATTPLVHWGGQSWVVGRAPVEAVAVNLDFSDGSRQTAPAQVDGWYVVVLDRALPPDGEVVTVTATAADGTVLAFKRTDMRARQTP